MRCHAHAGARRETLNRGAVDNISRQSNSPTCARTICCVFEKVQK